MGKKVDWSFFFFINKLHNYQTWCSRGWSTNNHVTKLLNEGYCSFRIFESVTCLNSYKLEHWTLNTECFPTRTFNYFPFSFELHHYFEIHFDVNWGFAKWWILLCRWVIMGGSVVNNAIRSSFFYIYIYFLSTTQPLLVVQKEGS